MLDLLLEGVTASPESIRVESGDTWVGSSRECGLTLRLPGIESKHFLFKRAEDCYRVVVASGCAPVRINGEPETAKRVNRGDVIEVGPAKITIENSWFDIEEPPDSAGRNVPRIIVQVPGRERAEFSIVKPRTVVGRDQECDICIPDHSLMREQFVLLTAENGILLKKLPGPSPVRINGNLTSSRTLNHGDEIDAGKTNMSFVSNRVAFKTLADLVYESRYGGEVKDTWADKEEVRDYSTLTPVDAEQFLKETDLDSEGDFQSRLTFSDAPGVLAEDNPLRHLLSPESVSDADDGLTDPHPAQEIDPFEKAHEEAHKYFLTIAPDASSTWIGGFSNFKAWVSAGQKSMMASKGTAQGFSKGFVILGPTGSGKRLAVRAASYLWRIPLIEINLKTVFKEPPDEWLDVIGGVMSRLLKSAPRMVLIADLDESIQDANDLVSQRPFVVPFYSALMRCFIDSSGKLLPVITATTVKWIHRDLWRRGRIVDELFFVDIPDARTRGEIWQILLSQEGIRSQDVNIQHLILSTDGLTGGEISQIVSVARSISQDKKVTPASLEIVALRRTPESISARDLHDLRSAAQKLCVPV